MRGRTTTAAQARGEPAWSPRADVRGVTAPSSRSAASARPGGFPEASKPR